jgi:hypothetical protein
MRWIIPVGASLALTLAASASAQSPPPGAGSTPRAPSGNPAIPCDQLPAAAVKSPPPPFDRYMRFGCTAQLGQGLNPVEGFHWRDQNGLGIGLSSSKQVGGPDAAGQVHFPFSWYVKLQSVALSAEDQQALRKTFERAILPRFLTGATILEMEAVTSNADEKRIFLVVPDTGPSAPKWLVGFECNGACFKDDPEPMMFVGEPNG